MNKMSGSRPLVRVLQGELRGIIEKSVNGKQYAAFKGIPYAKPPVGELRFQDPLPAEPWTHIMDASKFGLNCAQIDPMTSNLVGSDDCLYLNVYAPSEMCANESPPKPVMLWIHGGSFAYGSGDDNLYGPDYIVEKDVVLVTINYRLGVLGFLNLEDDVTTGNQGLKDQILALKWVQKNISNFGGDPGNVTIFGESAGGASVHYLTLSPLADGLYHKAISQSGVCLNPWASVAQSPKAYAQELAAALGETSKDSKILLEFLRSIKAQELVDVDYKTSIELVRRGTRRFLPSVDAKSKNPVLPVSPSAAAQSGVKVPYLIGHTSHEGIIFLIGITDKKLEIANSSFEQALYPGMVKRLRDKGLTPADLRQIYFGDKPISMETRLNFMEMQSDMQFLGGFHEVAKIQASRTECPTYLYNFSYDNNKSMVKAAYGLDVPGVCHADDLPYILYPKILQKMGVLPPVPGSTERLVIERVTQMWTDFAKTGNPTPVVSDTVPVMWKPLTNGEKLECLNIGENLRMELVTDVNKRYVKRSKSKL